MQEILQRVHDNGHVYKGTYEGWYCPRCADFKSEQEAGEDHTCPIHKIPLDREKEENWFFRLSTFQEPLEKLMAEDSDFVLPRQFRNEARAFVGQGLRDVSLTRARLKWGITVPWDPDQVFYVWFDALLNYVTALAFARDGEDLTDEFWPATFHLVGKDILKFHTIYWPALLLAAGLPVPEHVFVHGFLLMRDASGDEHKMSKSLGNVLDPFEVMETFGTDALRYYLFREVSFGQDGSVSTITFGERYEAELANELGNLASRTLSMIDRYRDGTVPEAELDPALAGDFDGLREEVSELLDRAEITQALDRIWHARAAAEPVRRADRAVAARQGRGERRRARPDAALARRGPARGDRAARALHPRDGRQAAGRARRPATTRSRAPSTARGPGGAHVEKLPQLFPKPS